MREFTVAVADDMLEDLSARLRATRWLEGEPADRPGYGSTVSTVREDVAFWLDRFDWRAVEARINAQPNFLVDIDGVSLHAIHRRSTRPGAIPLILIHGWPSSFLEFLDICDTLAEPDDGAPAFHVVVPSLPGYGFSETAAGMTPSRIATLFAELMHRFGYEDFVVQGGNWGSSVGTELARDFPERVIGLHLNSLNGAPPADAPELSPQDRELADAYSSLLSAPHFNLYAQTPLSLSHALNDSPAGTVAWIGEKLREWADLGLPGNPGLSRDWIVATAALYWHTGTAASAAALYADAFRNPALPRPVSVPTAVAHFAQELVMIPRAWSEPWYNIVRWTRIERGGHYPAVEVPAAFVNDLREFAATLCDSGNPG